MTTLRTEKQFPTRFRGQELKPSQKALSNVPRLARNYKAKLIKKRTIVIRLQLTKINMSF